MINVFYLAIEKFGGGMRLAVGEIGWPSGGGDKIAKVGVAKKYVWDLAERILLKNGTAKRPGEQIETCVQ